MYSVWGFSWLFFSFNFPCECRDVICKYAMTVFSQVFSTSLYITFLSTVLILNVVHSQYSNFKISTKQQPTESPVQSMNSNLTRWLIIIKLSVWNSVSLSPQPPYGYMLKCFRIMMAWSSAIWVSMSKLFLLWRGCAYESWSTANGMASGGWGVMTREFSWWPAPFAVSRLLFREQGKSCDDEAIGCCVQQQESKWRGPRNLHRNINPLGAVYLTDLLTKWLTRRMVCISHVKLVLHKY